MATNNYVYQIWSNEDEADEYISTTRQLNKAELNAFANILKELSNDIRYKGESIEYLTIKACKMFNARFEGVNAEVTDMPFVTSISF